MLVDNGWGGAVRPRGNTPQSSGGTHVLAANRTHSGPARRVPRRRRPSTADQRDQLEFERRTTPSSRAASQRQNGASFSALQGPQDAAVYGHDLSADEIVRSTRRRGSARQASTQAQPLPPSVLMKPPERLGRVPASPRPASPTSHHLRPARAARPESTRTGFHRQIDHQPPPSVSASPTTRAPRLEPRPEARAPSEVRQRGGNIIGCRN